MVLAPHRKGKRIGSEASLAYLHSGLQASPGSTGQPTLTADMQGICILRQERASVESGSEVARSGHVPRTGVFTVLGAQLTGKAVLGTLGKFGILGGVCGA